MPRKKSNQGPSVTLAGSLPRPELDGLSAISDALLNEPRAVRLVVGLVTVTKRTEDLIKDTYYPVTTFVQIEVPADVADQKVLGEILGKCLAQRTGMISLPFEPGTEYHHEGAQAAARPASEAAEA